MVGLIAVAWGVIGGKLFAADRVIEGRGGIVLVDLVKISK